MINYDNSNNLKNNHRDDYKENDNGDSTQRPTPKKRKPPTQARRPAAS